jgi:hypothetical protein
MWRPPLSSNNSGQRRHSNRRQCKMLAFSQLNSNSFRRSTNHNNTNNSSLQAPLRLKQQQHPLQQLTCFLDSSLRLSQARQLPDPLVQTILGLRTFRNHTERLGSRRRLVVVL